MMLNQEGYTLTQWLPKKWRKGSNIFNFVV